MKNKKILFAYIILITSSIFLIFFIIKIINWNIDNFKSNKELKIIKEKVVINEIDIKPDKDTNTTANIEKYYEIDINKLMSINSDTIGWLYVPNTNINYPFVQTDNNDYYLNHTFYKNANDAGSIFMDYRNNYFNDKNTIIYGHSRLDKTMFGTLKYILNKSWYTNKDNKYIYISTNSTNYIYEVFSTYKIDNENYYIQTKFENFDKYKDFLNKIINRSVYNFNVQVNEKDRIITLSTCSVNNKKVVLHAKLVSEIDK